MPLKNPPTPRRLRAQHANASRSTGPKTREGRRRAALNRREFVFSEGGREIMDHHQGDLREYQRIWRDLLAIFDFMGPQMEPYLAVIAADWWLKAHYAHRDRTPEALRGREERLLRIIDARLETELRELVAAYRVFSRQWRSHLQRELGSSGRVGLWHLRLAVETRLGPLQTLAAEGKLPQISPVEQELCQTVEELKALGEAF